MRAAQGVEGARVRVSICARVVLMGSQCTILGRSAHARVHYTHTPSRPCPRRGRLLPSSRQVRSDSTLFRNMNSFLVLFRLPKTYPSLASATCTAQPPMIGISPAILTRLNSAIHTETQKLKGQEAVFTVSVSYNCLHPPSRLHLFVTSTGTHAHLIPLADSAVCSGLDRHSYHPGR
jgi:hypothetical protein